MKQQLVGITSISAPEIRFRLENKIRFGDENKIRFRVENKIRLGLTTDTE